MRAAVHSAVTDLLREHDPRDIGVAAVAERSGVHQATIYRRWGSVPALVEEVVTEQLSRTSPLPDTGSLRGDLERYAANVADDLAHPLAAAYLRASLLGGEHADGPTPPPAYLRRLQQVQATLDRAAARGEPALSVQEVVEVILVPLYFHLLTRHAAPSRSYALTLADRLLTLAAARQMTDPAGLRPDHESSEGPGVVLGEGEDTVTPSTAAHSTASGPVQSQSWDGQDLNWFPGGSRDRPVSVDPRRLLPAERRPQPPTSAATGK